MAPDVFDLTGRSAVVTGGSGILGSAIASALAARGARVAILNRSASRAEVVVERLRATGAEAMVLTADVLGRDSLDAARNKLREVWGGLDILINAAGGNVGQATLPKDGSVFDLNIDSFRQVVDLNLLGTLVPIQVFSPDMIAGGHGSVVNISSMAADRALTRVAGYGAAKAALENLTRWTAVNLAQAYGGAIRVNAVAPGFFLSDQNRSLLMNADGTPTERCQTILARTPVGRLGDPDDLVGAVCWLASDASRFVTGVVVPVDGGFSAFSGV